MLYVLYFIAIYVDTCILNCMRNSCISMYIRYIYNISMYILHCISIRFSLTFFIPSSTLLLCLLYTHTQKKKRRTEK